MLKDEVTQCVIFHEFILRLALKSSKKLRDLISLSNSFVNEVEEIYKTPVFVQIFCSCSIICMTCFILGNETQNLTKTVSLLFYLLTILNQILIFCWSGNELIYSVSRESVESFATLMKLSFVR